jgi:hypothetical protein
MRCCTVLNAIHYLDNFFIAGAPGSQECATALRTALEVCEELGMPVAMEKLEGPAPVISFLGIDLDSQRMLPSDKLAMLQECCHHGQPNEAQPRGNCSPS